jgi:hypothetical protein
MAQIQSIEGIWEELALRADEFHGKTLRLTIVSEENPLSLHDEPQNLAEYLGDFIGAVAGSGANNSEDTGSKFTAHLHEKYREQRL